MTGCGTAPESFTSDVFDIAVMRPAKLPVVFAPFFSQRHKRVVESLECDVAWKASITHARMAMKMTWQLCLLTPDIGKRSKCIER